MCPQGHQNPDHYRHCGQCGVPLTPSSWPAPQAATPQQPGWYDDPLDSNALRQWDGQDWTPQRQRKPISRPGPPPVTATSLTRPPPVMPTQPYPPPQSPGSVYYPQPPPGRSTARRLWWFLAASLAALIALTIVVIAVTARPSLPPAPSTPSMSYRVGYSDVDKQWIIMAPGGHDCEANYYDEMVFADDPILHPGPVPTSAEDYMQGCRDAIRDGH
jgi:hypothetical protein